MGMWAVAVRAEGAPATSEAAYRRELRAVRRALRAKVRCAACGDWFRPARSDQRFCGAACRQRAHRARRTPSRDNGRLHVSRALKAVAPLATVTVDGDIHTSEVDVTGPAVTVAARVPVTLARQVKEIAQAEDRSVGSLVRRALSNEVERSVAQHDEPGDRSAA